MRLRAPFLEPCDIALKVRDDRRLRLDGQLELLEPRVQLKSVQTFVDDGFRLAPDEHGCTRVLVCCIPLSGGMKDYLSGYRGGGA